MKKVIIWILVIVSLLGLLLRFSSKAEELILGTKQISGISVLSDPTEATVYLDDKEVGKTPFEDKNLDTKEYSVRIEKGEASWQGKIKLTPGTVSIVNRDLAKEKSQSAGEILTLDSGRGITVVSNPSDGDVEIDGKSLGKTPITLNISSGEHTVLVSHANFLKRSVQVNLPNNLNLVVLTDLALSEPDLTSIQTPPISQTLEVLVKQTPTGYLRVRDKPSLSGKEIAQVKPGDKLVLLEETSEWDKIRLPDGKEGYVSSLYVEKVSSKDQESK